MDALSITIGKNLLSLRKNKGLTMEQLGEKLDTTPDKICRWEKGQYCPSAYYLIKLVRALECSFDDLCEGYEE